MFIRLGTIDPRSNTVVATIPIGSLTDTLFGSPTAVATDGSAVWVAKSAERAVARIDPATNRLTTTIALAVEPYAIAVNADDLWVTSFRSNQLLRVSASTGRVLATIAIPTPTTVAADADGVWVVANRAVREPEC